jgi:hypothetical protein
MLRVYIYGNFLNLNMLTSPFSYRFLLCLLHILFLFSVPLSAQEEEPQLRLVDTIDTSVDLFEETVPMHITLTLDLKKYQREKFEGEYMPVHFLYEINDTLQIEKTMRLKARGQFRRSHCNLAPFWLNIRKADVKNQHLQDINRVKIVTHCNGSKAYGDYVLKEYLCYKIYNIISPISFRVRLVRMTYVDTGRKSKVSEGWAFMIEPERVLAKRFGALVVKKDSLVTGLMRPEEMDLVALFQYMIGNADYSVAGRHNLKILGMPGFGTQGYTPVPYDFDYTGLVNAHYAVPGENLRINSVRERYYLGPCREDEAFIAAIEHINQYREEILQLVDDFEKLDSKYKKELIAYLEDYFALAGSFNELTSSLKRTCR